MPRHSRKYLSRSFKLEFGFLCFYRNVGFNNTRINQNIFRWCSLTAILIFLQYLYNTRTSYWSCANMNNETNETSLFKFESVYHCHQRILSYKRFMAMNYRFVNLGAKNLPNYPENTPICRFNRSSLGPIKVNKSPVSRELLNNVSTELRPGGFYAPAHCRSRHKVAILVPYRDRLTNLGIFLYYMHRLLQKQLLQYRIFVIEQYGNGSFNKGVLYNVAYLETQRFGNWHCLIFHDVDLIPMDERILYTCPRKPTHMSSAVENMAYKLIYKELFGGVTAMTPQQFLKVNGYSNYYWKWGAEDDDMFIRLQASRLPVLRLNMKIGRYATLPHKKAEINKRRHHALFYAKSRFRHEGLKTLQYKLLGISETKLITRILVDVNPFKNNV